MKEEECLRRHDDHDHDDEENIIGAASTAVFLPGSAICFINYYSSTSK